MAFETQSSVVKKASQPAVKPKQSMAGVRRVLRKVYGVLSSPIGLILLLVLYSFVGAALFQVIEGGHELMEKKVVKLASHDVIDAVWSANKAIKDNEASFRILMHKQLKIFEEEIRVSCINGTTTDTETRVWDFWGSLFYCATIYTTIGYGHIYPVTTAGRWLTMLYAIIGIPLCLIIMTDFGKLLTKGLKYLWSFVRRLWYTGQCLKAKLRKPKEGEEQVVVEEPEEYVVDDEFNLPISVAVVISIIYMLLGALMYSQWEEWSYLEAFYFIFISVSTIGFGDVLPDHPRYFLLSSVYILIGLSLVAMVITVIMENMSASLDVAKGKISEVTRTIGLGVDNEDETPMNTPAPTAATQTTATAKK